MQPREMYQPELRLSRGDTQEVAVALTQSLGHVVGVEDAAVDLGRAREDPRGHEGVGGDDKASPGVPQHLLEVDLCR